jgi:PmbA protein
MLIDLLERARAKGATAGEAILVEDDAFSVQVRLGTVETLKSAREQRLGLRLFFGHRSAGTATSDLSRGSLERLVEETCALARAMADDPYAGLPDADDGARGVPDLDLADPEAAALGSEERIALARRAEAAALAADPRITNSEGGEFGQTDARILYADTHGFLGEYRASSAVLSAAPVAAQDGAMQRDYWWTAKRKVRDLDSPEAVGRTAAERTLRRLGARKVPTQEAPVVFDPQTAGSLLRALAGAASGYAIYKHASFLVGKVGEPIASPLVTVLDDGTIPGGLGSKPFDGEGLATRRTVVVEGGVLRHYLLDTYSARKLGLRSTGNATRAPGESPTVGTTNLYLAAGASSPEAIIRSVRSGLFVTELIGFGVNLVTGDYSRGAVGVWIENGELAYPVEEITIAGNLEAMLRDIEMVGTDLEFRAATAAPTIKIARMTIAGR